MSWVMVLMGSIFGQQVEELRGCNDGARKRISKTQQVFVASDQMIGFADDGKL